MFFAIDISPFLSFMKQEFVYLRNEIKKVCTLEMLYNNQSFPSFLFFQSQSAKCESKVFVLRKSFGYV